MKVCIFRDKLLGLSIFEGVGKSKALFRFEDKQDMWPMQKLKLAHLCVLSHVYISVFLCLGAYMPTIIKGSNCWNWVMDKVALLI